MSRKKKGLALWLALFLGVSSLTGCGSGNDNMTQLSQKGADIMSSSDEEQDTDVEPLKTKTQLPLYSSRYLFHKQPILLHILI